MSVASKTPQQAFARKISRLSDPHPAVGAAEVRDGLPYEAFEALARTLGVPHDVLADVLGTSERTLQRRRTAGRLSTAESDRLWRVRRIHRLAVDAFDGRADEAGNWLRTPKRALGGDSPIEHLDTEPGTRLVEQMLAAIEHTMPA